MMMIVTEFSKFIYTRLPMWMWDSGDIFQAKLDYVIDYI